MRTKASRLKLLFFLFPFVAFLIAVKNIRNKAFYSIILMFSFIYGYSVYMYSGDVVNYAESFQTITRASWSNFFYLLKQSYTGKNYGIGSFGIMGTQPDIYALTLQFLVSRFTDNCRWFFAIVSLIYTSLFLAFINELLLKVRWTGSVWQKVFFIYLLIVVPFYYPVIGVRFWAALYVFMLFSLRHIRHSTLTNLIWASTSILFHFSFILPVALLWLYQVVKLNKFLSILLVIISTMLFVITSRGQVTNSISNSSALFEDTRLEQRLEGYTNTNYLANRHNKLAKVNWYARWNKTALQYFLVIAFLVEFIVRLRWKQNEFLNNLYPLYVLFYILTVSLFSVVGRYHYIFDILSLVRFTMLIGLNPNSRYLKVVATLLIPILFLHIAVIARSGFYTVDPLLPISPAIVLFLTQSNISLSELIVGH